MDRGNCTPLNLFYLGFRHYSKISCVNQTMKAPNISRKDLIPQYSYLMSQKKRTKVGSLVSVIGSVHQDSVVSLFYIIVREN